MSPSRYFALVPAAGIGTRMQAELPKQYLPLLGQPMLRRTVSVFPDCPQIAGTYVVVAAHDEMAYAALAGLDAGILRCGGATRAQSVRNGLRALREQLADHDWVLVHDAARPGLTPQLVAALIAGVADDAVGGLLALPVVDTVKRADADGCAAQTLARDGLWLAQTPQMFRYKVLLDAMEQMGDDGAVTDEAGAIEAMGLRARLVEGHPRNLKVTLPRDLAIVSMYLKEDE